MRKSIRRSISSTKSPRKPVLQLSRETVRTLTSEELRAAGGVECPTGSSETRQPNSSLDAC
jgi:hypothetical protein